METYTRRARQQRVRLLTWRRQLGLAALAIVAAVIAALVLLLADAAGILPGGPLSAPATGAGSIATISLSPTVTPSPTATATPTPVTLKLISPSSHKGPVGANLTLTGANWTSSTVSLGISAGADCSTAQQMTTASTSSGSFSGNFIWPSSFASVGTAYLVCVSDANLQTAATHYTVLSSSPPIISLSVASVQVGGTVSVTGHNFYGVSNVKLSVTTSSPSASRVVQSSVPVDSNGSFLTQYTPPATDTGSVILSAASSQENGASPALRATAQLAVGAAATPTLSPTISPTAQSTVGAAGGGSTHNSAGPSTGLIVILVVAILLVLLLIIALLVIVMMRRRSAQGSGPDGPGDGYNGGYNGAYGPSGPGYGGALGPIATGRMEATNAYGAPNQTGRIGAQAGPGQYGRSGFYGQSAPYGPSAGEYAGPSIGGVAQWGEPDDEPDANWQPRPMSGGRRYAPDIEQPSEPFSYPDLPPVYGQDSLVDDAPIDPWGDAPGAFGPSGALRPPRPGVKPEPGLGGRNTGRYPASQPFEPPIYGGMPPGAQQNSQRYDSEDSQNATRPTGPTPVWSSADSATQENEAGGWSQPGAPTDAPNRTREANGTPSPVLPENSWNTRGDESDSW